MWATTAPVLLPYPQAKRILDRLKRLALGRELPDDGASSRHDKQTRQGRGHAARPEAAGPGGGVGGRQE